MTTAEDLSVFNWHAVLLRLLKPLTRFALRHGLKIQDVEAALAESMVQQAQIFLASQSQESNASRLSVMTGIHRREISRQLGDSSGDQNPSLIAKVLSIWQHTARYTTANGKPRQLTAGSDGSEFNCMVREVSKELNPAVVLFELQRVGAVAIASANGKSTATLVKGSFSPSDRLGGGMEILASDINDLILSVEENLTTDSPEKNLHARTVFDNVYAEDVEELKRWIRTEGHDFHRRLREKLAELDNDINPQSDRKGKKLEVVVSSFGRVLEE